MIYSDPDPATNFFRIQPIIISAYLEIIFKNTLNSIKKKDLITTVYAIFYFI